MSVTLVTGPPCAGKSTHVSRHASPGALIVCWDSIALDLGAEEIHPTPYLWRETIAREYQRRLDLARTTPEAWVIRTLPDPDERAMWVREYGAELVTLCPPRSVLMKRAEQRRNPARTAADIDWWLAANPDLDTEL